MFLSLIARVFSGQILLLIGEVTEDVRLMAFGLFIFGLEWSTGRRTRNHYRPFL